MQTKIFSALPLHLTKDEIDSDRIIRYEFKDGSIMEIRATEKGIAIYEVTGRKLNIIPVANNSIELSTQS